MSNDTTDTNNEDIFSSPESFHAALDKIAEEPAQEEQVEEPEIEEEEEQEQEAEETEEEEVEPIDTPDGMMVPKKRLEKEIQKRKEVEASVQREREEVTKARRDLENYQKTLAEYFKKPEENQEEEEFEPLDPDSHSAVMKKIAALEAKLAEKEQKDHVQQAQNTFRSDLLAHQSGFEKDTPDYKDAYKHLLLAKRQEYIDLGYDQAEAEHRTMSELQHKAASAWQNGKNTAELVYNMAKRAGYTPKAEKARSRDVDLDVLERNMKKSASITNIAGSTAAGIDIGNPDAISKLTKAEGRMIDPKKFQALLRQQEQRNRR